MCACLHTFQPVSLRELCVRGWQVEVQLDKKKGKIGGIGGMVNKAVDMAGAGAKAVGEAALTKAMSEDAAQVKNLRKFMDLKVFSSTEEANRLELERQRGEREKWCGILHPETGVSIFYNQMHIFLLIYTLVFLPVRTAFQITPTADDWAFWTDLGIDVAIVLDIVLNFSRYHYDKGVLVTDRATIRNSYLRSWFAIDVISVLPFDHMVRLFLAQSADEENLARATRFMRFTRIMRFARLIKLARLQQLEAAIKNLQHFLNSVGVSAMELEFALRQLGLVCILLAVVHIVGCMWLHVGRSGLQALDADGQPAPEGWLFEEGWFPANGSVPENVYIHEQYVSAVYWAIVTMCTVGYGDVLPITTAERTVAIFVMCLGTFLYAYIIGAFSTIMAHNGYDKARYDTKIRQVNTWLNFIDADPELIERTLKFYEYRYQNKLMFDDHRIVEELPATLRGDLVLHRFQKTIDNVPFFRNLREDTVVAICMKFHQFAVLPGDFITHRGDPYRELLVLTKGICRTVPEGMESPRSSMASPRVSTAQGSIRSSGASAPAVSRPIDAVVEYATGAFFGDLEFLGLSDERQNDIRAKVYCELSSLHPKDVEEVIRGSPQLQQRLHRYVELKTKLAELAAEGGLTEMEIERIKQEMEDDIDEPLSEDQPVSLTAKEMQTILGEEESDMKKILRAVEDISDRLAKLEKDK